MESITSSGLVLLLPTWTLISDFMTPCIALILALPSHSWFHWASTEPVRGSGAGCPWPRKVSQTRRGCYLTAGPLAPATRGRRVHSPSPLLLPLAKRQRRTFYNDFRTLWQEDKSNKYKYLITELQNWWSIKWQNSKRSRQLSIIFRDQYFYLIKRTSKQKARIWKT